MKKKFRVIKNWVSHNRVLILLCLVLFLILGIPLVKYGINGSFYYRLDPDVVYVTNAVRYTTVALISYIDHPGTPTIVLISYLFYPFRLVAKYMLHERFIQWSFDNYAFLTYYIRVFMLSLTTVATFVYLKGVRKLTNSIWLMFFVVFCLFSFGGIIEAIQIAPENLSTLLTAIWLYVFLLFIKKRGFTLNIFLALLAGFALANKFTSLFLIILSILLSFYGTNIKVKEKILRFFANCAAASFAFYIGIFPVIGRLSSLKSWVYQLFGHSELYGTGSATVFDPTAYLLSFKQIFSTSPALVLFICLAFILGIVVLIKRKLPVNHPVILLIAVSFFGFLTFAKYPNIRYNYVNILLLIFCVTYFLTLLKTSFTKVLTLIMLILFILSIFNYMKMTRIWINIGQDESIPSVLNRWTPFWSDDVYREQLDAVGVLKL